MESLTALDCKVAVIQGEMDLPTLPGSVAWNIEDQCAVSTPLIVSVDWMSSYYFIVDVCKGRKPFRGRACEILDGFWSFQPLFETNHNAFSASILHISQLQLQFPEKHAYGYQEHWSYSPL